MEQVTEKAELEQNQLGSQNKHTKQKSLKQTIINKHFVATRIRLAGIFFCRCDHVLFSIGRVTIKSLDILSFESKRVAKTVRHYCVSGINTGKITQKGGSRIYPNEVIDTR